MSSLKCGDVQVLTEDSSVKYLKLGGSIVPSLNKFDANLNATSEKNAARLYTFMSELTPMVPAFARV